QMIQFTAPISSGSSGGALLDMFGNLLGLISAGYDDGQNLNLAVESNLVKIFANNFIEIVN
ncbi:TPA: serine protease, partial [Clostridioides difficile]|nr:serine protease [Clostridioides difficile]